MASGHGGFGRQPRPPAWPVPSSSSSTGAASPADIADLDILRPDSSYGTRQPTTVTVPDPASVTENGRTYNGYRYGKYLLPNDGEEQDRLDFQHRLWTLMMDDELMCAPIFDPPPSAPPQQAFPRASAARPRNAPLQVLDLGTGTGIWANEFAERYPEANVVGTDISRIQPENTRPNVQFYREDAEEEWVFGYQFDYIHLRLMSLAFANPRAMVDTIFANLRPGGWVEYQEICPEQVGADPASERAIAACPCSYGEYLRRVAVGAARHGRDIRLARSLRRWLQEAGFVDVQVREILAPLNPWCADPKDKKVGQYASQNYLDASYLAGPFLDAYGMSKPEADVFMDGVRAHIIDTSVHSYIPWHVVYGRKPF